VGSSRRATKQVVWNAAGRSNWLKHWYRRK
jgi:hypothetical protein